MNEIQAQIKNGVQAQREGQLDLAEQTYRWVLEQEADNATALNNLGFLCAQQQRWPEARAQLEKALALRPGDASAHSNLGQVLVALGQKQDGLSHLEKAVQLAPENPAFWDNLGRMRLRAGEAEAAEYAWLRALALQGSDPRLLMKLGTALAAQRRLPEAVARLQQSLALKGDYADAWAQLGVAHFMRNDHGSAEEALGRALSLQPRDTLALRHMALLKLSQGQTEAAIAGFSDLLTIDSQDHGSRIDLAVCLLSRARADDCLLQLDTLVEKGVEDPRIPWYRALALRQLQQAVRGDKLLRQVAASDSPYAQKARQLLQAS